MMLSLEKYEEDNRQEDKIAKNPILQARFILMILGLWRRNFDMISIFANEMGWFDGKVKELYTLFAKYKDTIFRHGVVGLPPIRKNL